MRAARPDIAFSSDFIVGFPGETEDDFRATLALVDEVGYAGAFSFKYSPRPGTPAADMAEQVPEDGEGRAAARGCRRAIDRQQAAFNARLPRQDASTCCSRRPAATRARSSAARPICSRCRSWRRSPSSARSVRVTIDGSHRQQPVRRAGTPRACTTRPDAGGSRRLSPLRTTESDTGTHAPRPRMPRARRRHNACRARPSTTTASPRSCSGNTARTSR